MYNRAVTEIQLQNQIENFFSGFQAFSFKADDTLIQTGDTPLWIYYLKSGIIKQTAVSPAGQENTITFFKPGAFFPLIWAIKDTEIPYDFRAVNNGHGWRAPRHEVIAYLKQNAAITFDLTTRLLSGLEGLSRKLQYSIQATAADRIYEALVTLAYRFSENTLTNVKIELPLTHQNVADITGLSRETVSRELKAMRDSGLIVIEKHRVIIPDLTALEKKVAL